MANELLPLNRVTPEMSYNDIDDVYLHIPFRNKLSINYRTFVKGFGSLFDSIEQRWYLKSNKLSENIKSEISRLNLYDGLRYVVRQDNPFYMSPDYTEFKIPILRKYKDNVVISKQINFDRRIAVQYFSFNNTDQILEIFVDRFYDEDYTTLPQKLIQSKILRVKFLPASYARANWKHYAAKKNDKMITDIHVTGLQKICDSFVWNV